MNKTEIEWIKRILEVCKILPEHRFYLLTKQPQNLAKFSPFPDNCWVGVSATNYSMFQVSCEYLSNIEAPVKYISLEPLLLWESHLDVASLWMQKAGISWLIIGAQTKPYSTPEIEWVKEIIEAANHAGVKVFLKNNLRKSFVSRRLKNAVEFKRSLTDNIDLFYPVDSRDPSKRILRQELPL